VLLLSLLWFGNYKLFEKVLTVFVILMVLCFVMAFVMLKPDMKEILLGLTPRIPRQAGKSWPDCCQWQAPRVRRRCLLCGVSWCRKKGWGVGDLQNEKRDAFVSSSIMLFLSAIIMAVAAGTLHLMGLRLNSTIEMVQLFEPLGSKVAISHSHSGHSGCGIIYGLSDYPYCTVADLRLHANVQKT